MPPLKEAVKAPPAKKDKTYYFSNMNSASLMLHVQVADQRMIQKVQASNSVAVIRADDPFYAEKVAFMNKHVWNKKNNGAEFFELKNGVMPDDGKCLLDELLDLNDDALVTMLKSKTKATMAMSRGNLILKVLKEKGAI